MLRLPASLGGALRLIGAGFGSEARLIAAMRSKPVRTLSVGDQPTLEAHREADQAELTQ